jgi:hypothetical protein
MLPSRLRRAGTVSIRGLVAFAKFWYGFVIGDDWTVAAAVAAALVVTWVLHNVGLAAWWLPPLVAVAATGDSLRRTSSTSASDRPPLPPMAPRRRAERLRRPRARTPAGCP